MSSDKEYYDNSSLVGKEKLFIKNALPFIEVWTKSYFENSNLYEAEILELGAGSCTTGAIVSKYSAVKSVTECDISEKKMIELSKSVCDIVGGDFSKLKFKECDFNLPLPFADATFDVVIMDAALHHSRNMFFTLSEIKRVLKSDGVFIAQREQYVSPLTHWLTFRRLLQSPEVCAGVSENAYLKSQYDYYLRASGFVPKFRPVLSGFLQNMLFFLNGLVFSKYNIVSTIKKN